MVKVEIQTIKSGSILKGTIEASELPFAFRDEQGLPNSGTLKVECDVAVEWDDDIPMPYVTSFGIVLAGLFIEITEKQGIVDFDTLNEELSSWHCDEWYEDRSASLADNPYFDLER